MPPEPVPVPPLELPSQPKLLDQLRGRLRVKHYSIRTEQAYVDWVRRFVLFHGKRHPRALGQHEAEAFLTHLGGTRAGFRRPRRTRPRVPFCSCTGKLSTASCRGLTA